MASLADALHDRFVIRSISLLRIEAGIRRKVIAMLKKLEGELAAQVARIDPTGVAATSYQKARMQALLKQTRETLKTAYSDINRTVSKDLREIAVSESQFVLNAINQAVGVELASVAVTRETLAALASDAIVEGQPARTWWSRQAGTTHQRFIDAMQQGILRSETNGQLVQRVRGTKAKGYADGIMETSRKSAERLVRTSAMSVANEARMLTYENNSDICRGYVQLSTLDARTCLVAGTSIETPYGFRNIDKIRMGDLVVGGSGEARSVIGTKQSKTRRIAVVKLSNGETIRCTPDHLFLLTNQEWQEAQDLTIGMELAIKQEV